MVNPRRGSYSINSQNPENPFQIQSFSLTSLLNLLKRPLAFPLLLSIFIFLTWVSLKFQHSSNLSTVSHNPQRWSKEEDLKANLVRFLPSKLTKDERGWLVNPVAAALDAGISGGALSCVSVHVGEIRPGGVRGNHRHYNCNETFILWGALIKFRLENSKIADKGYAEVVIGADEVAVAASPSGTAHALVNVDPIRTAYLLGCQDDIVTNSSNTAYKIWSDL
ncbi:UDP-2-acetamido-2 6-beta-L-arabino-hexul-4-ose reductase [Bienertia sinuspersici]